jgi:GTP-binding protein
MFVDSVQLVLKAGNGGNGSVSFRHEIYVDRGGPDGGDGGNGGNVVLVASTNQDTLAAYRYKKEMRATDGSAGSKQKKHGKNGIDLELSVPVGTVVVNADDEVLADLVLDGQRTIVAQGGSGGYGNAHFTSSIRQAPRVAEKGEKGQELEVRLELKMIADVGLVGLPNAGKSTLLASVSNARPEIADYAFTTLSPNLGVVDVDGSTLLLADIPGLIEGASEGKGLGDEFLRHVERTAVLVHLVDAYQDDVAAAYKTITQELKNYEIDLTKKPQIVALNKVEGLDDEIVADRLAELQAVIPKSTKLFAISAMSKQGTTELLREVQKIVTKQRVKQAKADPVLPVISLEHHEKPWKVEQKGKTFIVTGTRIEKFAHRTDFENPHGVRRLRDIMRKMGIMAYLEKQKIEPGNKILIGPTGEYEVDY